MHPPTPPTHKYARQPCKACGKNRNVPNPAWLTQRRKNAGLTLRAMAEDIGLSHSYIYDIESGRRMCTARVLEYYEEL